MCTNHAQDLDFRVCKLRSDCGCVCVYTMITLWICLYKTMLGLGFVHINNDYPLDLCV